ncbi:hypothetical protein BV394_00215 [Brevirhabdus pacifica]|uniref:Uncharacterized protein n=1 Tax=Brevirhabdus pacifica TaxID=1267768 RepID=A0A1U7DEC2_9RHOB|nr:phosphotransferase [Brevirhabdus pacifica]APX88347.1 hypothetical protein BV394_00215 [Brevirhabdus pacifica]OWU79669.1 hypothetical protein ATO5_00910 [Loktanella sp. 22II-4b]PJJ87200.1 hypothetical protein CLV77_1767 [Brevirhabdus pacifica]
MNAVTTAPGAIKAEPVFRRWAEVIAGALTQGKPGKTLDFKLLKSSHTAVSYRAETGTERGFVKLFDPFSRAAREAYARERDALLMLRESGLVPRHIGHSDDDCMVLVDYVEPAEDPLAGESRADCVKLARRCGAWLAEYEAIAPSRRQSGNWFDYLVAHDRYSQLLSLAQMQPWLQEIPLCGSILSRCDGSLSNFLFAADGSIAGCDFEQARFKPRGYDFAVTYLAFASRWPLHHEVALEAMADGFSSRHRGVLDPQELMAVARALFILEADTARGRI